ncbi:unnamed protein product [Chilo suppressalis]|uniref:Uncharacterized protein n=1 Tax=Chilo suppressalis TaxID=168631 RepID=A0ABN8BE84_CHISP|nr:unnamed protein product [Chilo suppressalis]
MIYNTNNSIKYFFNLNYSELTPRTTYIASRIMLTMQSCRCYETSSAAQLKWKWAGHVARNESFCCQLLLEWKPWDKNRPQERPQMRWKDDVKKVAGSNWI